MLANEREAARFERKGQSTATNAREQLVRKVRLLEFARTTRDTRPSHRAFFSVLFVVFVVDVVLLRSHPCHSRNRRRRRRRRRCCQCYERDCGVAITTNCIVTRKLRDYCARVDHRETLHTRAVVAREKTEKWSRGKGGNGREPQGENNSDERGEGREKRRERKRDSAQTTTVYTFRLQLARSSRAQIARVIEFSLLRLARDHSIPSSNSEQHPFVRFESVPRTSLETAGSLSSIRDDSI